MERPKSRSPIDKEVEVLTADLLDRISSMVEAKENPGNALSLLQSFVRKQTPTSSSLSQVDASINDENSNLSEISASSSSSSSSSSLHLPSCQSIKSNESPLASLEKMLAYPSPTDSSTPSITDQGTKKKKKFDKYRLFAEKMLRSTLS